MTNVCFHHPDRETGRRCTRCGRPACPECLVQASVGAQCWQCVKAAAPPRSEQVRRWWTGQPLFATYAIIAVNVITFIVIVIRDGTLGGGGRASADLALFGPAVNSGDYYRLITYSVVHYGFLHIFFNMIILLLVGRVLEPGAGHLRFTVLYVVSVLGGAAGALIFSPHDLTGGASGGVFGIAAAATLVLLRQGMRFADTAFGPLLVINFLFGFVSPERISIGGHVGGLLAGLIAAEGMLRARQLGRPELGYAAALAVGAVSVVIALAASG